MISRRALVTGSVATAFGARAETSDPGPLSDATPTLGDAAEKAGILYGASVSQEVFADPDYAALYRRETKILVTDVALKFDWIRPTQDRFEFDYADAIMRTAHENGKLVRGHTLIWNDNTPAWLKRLSGREVERVFDKHIDTVVSRYAGKLQSWDVVNEPFWPMDGKPGGWRDGPWYAAMGPSYVERAFRRVAAIDKTARLTLNEAQCDNNHDWGRSIRPRLRALVDRLLHDGAPLHAIGLQSHLQPQWPSNYPEFAAYAASFGANGLDVYLSEFDVNDESLPDDVKKRDAAVADLARAFLDAVLAVPAIKMLINWQLSDRYSWYGDVARKKAWLWPRAPRPLPFDQDYRSKPMRAAMLAAFFACAERRANGPVTPIIP